MALGVAIWLGLIFGSALMVVGVVVGAIALYDKRTVFVIEALHRDESGAVQGRLRLAINILFRLVIIAQVGIWLWIFSDTIWFYLHRFGPEVIDGFSPGGGKVKPFDLFALFGGGVVGPGLALAAIVLAAANKYLAFAALSAIASYFFFVTSCC